MIPDGLPASEATPALRELLFCGGSATIWLASEARVLRRMKWPYPFSHSEPEVCTLQYYHWTPSRPVVLTDDSLRESIEYSKDAFEQAILAFLHGAESGHLVAFAPDTDDASTSIDITAEALFQAVRAVSSPIRTYKAIVKPQENESRRFSMTLMLLPVVLSNAIAMLRSESIQQAVIASHGIYLDGLDCATYPVSLGDLIIWPRERKVLIESSERFLGCQLWERTFETFRTTYQVLLPAVAEIRKALFLVDMQYAAQDAPHDDAKKLLQLVFLAAATTFTKQLLQINPNESTTTPEMMKRFHTSTGLASTVIGEMWFHISDLLKAQEAQPGG